MKQNLTSTFFCIILAVVCIAVPHNVKAAIAGKASSNASLNRGLIGYWTFDGKDMPNGVALDKSGNGHTGLIYNIATSTFYGEGKIGQGLKFDGSNDFIEIGQTSLTNNMTAMSVSFWLNTSSFASCGSGNAAIIEKQYFTHGWLLGCSNTGYLGMTVYTTGGNGGMTVRTSVPITTNKWKHVVFSWDGNLNGAGAKFYIDGVDSTNLTQAGTGSRIDDSTVPLHIARDVYDGQFYGGLMDDVRLYNRALTAAEVQQLYALGGSKQAVSSKVTNTSCSSGLSCGLKAYWTFDGKDVVNGVLLDKSGLGNTGNFVNIATSTFYTEGKIGQGVKLDGSDDHVNVSAVANDVGLGSFTMSGWFKPKSTITSSLSSPYYFFTLADGASTNDVRICIARAAAGTNCSSSVSGVSGGKLCILVYNGSGDNAACTSQSTWNANTWYHFVAIMDISGGGEKIYINGVLAGSNAATARGTTQAATACISAEVSTTVCLPSSRVFLGSIDDFHIYNRALSATEVQQLYALGASKQAVSSKITTTSCTSGLSCGLVGYWTFDGKDMANGVALDKSGNGNKGNLTNIATSTFYTDGKIGQGAKFDGVDDYVSVGGSAGSVQTISYWVKSNNQANGGIELNADQYITDNAIPEGMVSPTVYVDGVVKTLYGSEKVTNGDMEANSTWSQFGFAAPTSQARSSEQAHQGTFSWKIVSPSGYRGSNQSVSVSGSTQYKVSGWIYTSSGVGGLLSFRNDDNSSVADAVPSVSAAWKYASAYGTTASSPSQPEVALLSNNGATTIYADDVSLKQVIIRYPITDTRWHHVVITTNTSVTASAIKLGKGGSSYLNGSLDDVRIYNRALSATEVQQLYNAGR